MLLDVQRAVRATVLSNQDSIAPFVRAARGPVASRIAVYRNTVQKSLVDVLEVAFPVVCRIVGPRFFYEMARDFVHCHPPTVPQLSVYGADFPAFLAAHPQISTMPYLHDVALLEWARGESYFAADAAALNPAALSALSPEQLPELKLLPHPALRVVQSQFPIHRIWTVNQPSVTDVPMVEMDVAECVLITRPQYEVFIRKPSKGEAVLAAACAEGHNLNDAVVKALDADRAFDLQAALQLHFMAGTFTSFQAA